MPSLRQIRRRIRSVENTGKVTHAMEMIAATKMRRAQAAVLATRPYSAKITDVIAHLAAQKRAGEEVLAPLLEVRPVKTVHVIHISPDRGLCGGLHSNLNRRTAQFILQQQVPVRVVTVGRKGRDFMVRYERDVKAVFTDLGDRPRLADVLPIAHLAIEDFTEGEADEVYITYPQFVSTMVQRVIMQRLLPVETQAAEGQVDFIYEPNPRVVLGALLPRFVEMQVYQAILELVASEQSARMVAMRNATDNAKDMVEDLTLELNKVRQETITKELLDIVGGAAALEG